MQPEVKPKRSRRLVYVVIVVVILGVASVAAFVYLQPQPNIQITQVEINYDDNSNNSDLYNYGYIAYDRINLSQTFSVTAISAGTYGLVFDNTLSFTLTETVSVTYALGGHSHTESFSIGPGEVKTVEANLTNGEQFSGTFTVIGGILDDTVKVNIDQTTCQETVAYSYVLVNAGSSGGFVDIGLRTNHTIASNKYFVAANDQSPQSGTLIIPQPFCESQVVHLVVLDQQRG